MIESMNGRDVEALLRSMISYLQVRNVRLDDSKPVSYGNTHDESYGCVSYGIGVQEFVERPDDDFSSTDVMYAVVALGHEVCGHGCQIQHEFYNKDKVLSKVLALNYYACAGSPYYYGVLDDGTLVNADNYFRQPYEIAAQYAGIKSAYLFLEHKFDKETADELVCRYVESRIEKDSEFIDSMPQERTADAVLEAFDDAFKHAVTAHRDYSLSKAGEDIVRIASRTMGGEEPAVLRGVCGIGRQAGCDTGGGVHQYFRLFAYDTGASCVRGRKS